MRLNELTGYKNRQDIAFVKKSLSGLDGQPREEDRRDILDAFLENLEDKGFTRLGNGAFGAVFTHPSLNYAIKVFNNDPAYLTFIRIALRMQGNPFFPKFRGKFMHLGDDYYAVRIELLKTISTSDTLNLAKIEWYRYISSFGPQLGLQEVLQRLAAYRSDRPGMQEAAADIVAAPADAKAILALAELGLSTALNMDLKRSNFMLRGDRMVVIDPYWDENVIGLF